MSVAMNGIATVHSSDTDMVRVMVLCVCVCV